MKIYAFNPEIFKEELNKMEQYSTGAKRSSRMPRYDLIPKIFLERLAERYTGHEDNNGTPDGGALEYGEVNWMKGLPTSDVISHILNHITEYSDALRAALYLYGTNMERVRKHLIEVSQLDDHLAGAAWGIAALMHQEQNGMFHDDRFKSGSSVDEVVNQETNSSLPSPITPLTFETVVKYLQEMGFDLVPIAPKPDLKATPNGSRKAKAVQRQTRKRR